MSSTPSHTDEEAFENAVASIAPDMPLLMHGCGDVAPSDVNPETARLVAELTVKYISELVDAAVDAHDILTDGAGGLLPPPPLSNKRKVPSLHHSANNTPKRRKNADYWDEPLPEPKIRPTETSNESNELKAVNADEWCGVAGVDFFQDSRSRSAFVSAPLTAIGVQSFVFPVCHDAGLYGRVMEVQAARRNIAPVLMDSTWLDMVNAEGGRLGGSSQNKRPETPAPEDTEQEDEENAEEEVLPSWPGLESLLPIHREG